MLFAVMPLLWWSISDAFFYNFTASALEVIETSSRGPIQTFLTLAGPRSRQGVPGASSF